MELTEIEDKIASGEMSAAQVFTQMKQHIPLSASPTCSIANLGGVVLKKYSTIVVDPPWKIAKIKRRVRPNQKTMDYPTMTLDQIKNMPIESIAEDTAHCFLWTIDKYLFDAKDVLEAWGFKYHCTLAWNKTNGISLYGINRRVEFVLVGLRGKHEAYPKRKTIPAAFTARSERHSAKPQEFYDFLSVLSGAKIDIFARQERAGWDVWGNEVDSDIDLAI